MDKRKKIEQFTLKYFNDVTSNKLEINHIVFPPLVDIHSVNENKNSVMKYLLRIWDKVVSVTNVSDFGSQMTPISVAFDANYPFMDLWDGKMYGVHTVNDHVDFLIYFLETLNSPSSSALIPQLTTDFLPAPVIQVLPPTPVAQIGFDIQNHDVDDDEMLRTRYDLDHNYAQALHGFMHFVTQGDALPYTVFKEEGQSAIFTSTNDLEDKEKFQQLVDVAEKSFFENFDSRTTPDDHYMLKFMRKYYTSFPITAQKFLQRNKKTGEILSTIRVIITGDQRFIVPFAMNSREVLTILDNIKQEVRDSAEYQSIRVASSFVSKMLSNNNMGKLVFPNTKDDTMTIDITFDALYEDIRRWKKTEPEDPVHESCKKRYNGLGEIQDLLDRYATNEISKNMFLTDVVNSFRGPPDGKSKSDELKDVKLAQRLVKERNTDKISSHLRVSDVPWNPFVYIKRERAKLESESMWDFINFRKMFIIPVTDMDDTEYIGTYGRKDISYALQDLWNSVILERMEDTKFDYDFTTIGIFYGYNHGLNILEQFQKVIDSAEELNKLNLWDVRFMFSMFLRFILVSLVYRYFYITVYFDVIRRRKDVIDQTFLSSTIELVEGLYLQFFGLILVFSYFHEISAYMTIKSILFVSKSLREFYIKKQTLLDEKMKKLEERRRRLLKRIE